jgi:hypothetical protein
MSKAVAATADGVSWGSPKGKDVAMSRAQRNRRIYVLLILVTVLAGLSTRVIKQHLPTIGDMAGDALWATMVFFILSFLWPATSTAKRAAGAVAISFAVEFSQLYHRPWIDEIRRTWLGAMVLGWGFDWRDLLCYVAGVFLGIIVERWARRA